MRNLRSSFFFFTYENFSEYQILEGHQNFSKPVYNGLYLLCYMVKIDEVISPGQFHQSIAQGFIEEAASMKKFISIEWG